MIHLKELTRYFGPTLAVDRLSLDIAPGEVFGLLGPNGAGKTTTIRILACLLRPTSGEAWVNGLRVGRDNHAIRSQVGLLTETPGLYGKLTAYENLAIYARLYEVDKPERQIERYLRLVGLWEHRNERVDRFSHGMRQKIAIVRALLHEPPVLLLDEPTTALDPQAAKTVRDFLIQLRGQGRTILLCTHNLDVAERLCDRVGVLNQRLLAVDTPERLAQQIYGHQTVLHLRPFGPNVVEAIRSLPFVQDVDVEDHKIAVTLDDPSSQNHRLIEAVIAAGGQVIYVTKGEHTLEDAYLRLVSDR